MTTAPVPVSPVPPPVSLTATQFHTLAEIPPELEWFVNLPNPNTRRAYRQDLDDFMAFAGLHRPEQFRDVTRAHVIAWRDQLVCQGLATIASGANWRRCPRSMLISASVTPCCITPC